MNIQITNIPNGQKIKSIDFKIIFDESGEVSGNNYSIDKIETPRSAKESVDIEPETKDNISNNVPIQIDDISNRIPKEVPAEMLDLEF